MKSTEFLNLNFVSWVALFLVLVTGGLVFAGNKENIRTVSHVITYKNQNYIVDVPIDLADIDDFIPNCLSYIENHEFDLFGSQCASPRIEKIYVKDSIALKLPIFTFEQWIVLNLSIKGFPTKNPQNSKSLLDSIDKVEITKINTDAEPNFAVINVRGILKLNDDTQVKFILVIINDFENRPGVPIIAAPMG